MPMRSRRAHTLALPFLAVLLVGLLVGGTAGPQVHIHTAAGRDITLTVEVAATPAQRERGLMFRKSLPSGHGMLFVFPKAADHQFWMRNTPISLDIAFIDDGYRIVGIQADTEPYSERRLSVGKPSRYVLEVPAGFCAARGITVGDQVDLAGIDEVRSEAGAPAR